MAAPAIGRRQRWVPPPTAQVDWSHPLAAGLEVCWLHHGDLCGQPVTRVGMTEQATALGTGLYSPSASDYVTIGTARNWMLGPGTFRLIFRPISLTNGSYSVLVDAGSATNSRSVFIDMNSSGQASWTAFQSQGGGTNNTITALNTLTDLVVVRPDTTANALTWYRDGAYSAATSTSGSAGSSNYPGAINLGRSVTSSDGHVVGVYVACQLWPTRALTAGEVAQLYADPFCMLRY